MQAHSYISQQRQTGPRMAAAVHLAGKYAEPIIDNRGPNPLQAVKDNGMVKVIQRALDASGVSAILDTSIAGGRFNRPVQELAALVQSYNETHDEDDDSQEALHGQEKKLDDIEKKAHEMLRDAGLPNTARQPLFDFLDTAEKEHVELTDRGLKANIPLWLPEGTSEKDNADAQEIWKSLTTDKEKEKGNIRLKTKNKDFKKQTHASFAQLLRGTAGRALLKELNSEGSKKKKRSPGRQVYISDSINTNFPGLRAAPAATGSYAEPYSRAHGNPDTFSEKDGGVANSGTGAYVQVDRRAPASDDDRLTGETGHAIYTPAFITLGHELGHAQAHLRGRTRDTYPDGDDYESRIWSNPEERRNITGVENALRDDHGIAKRKYHYTKGAARHLKYKMEFNREMEAIWALVPQNLRDGVNAEVEDFGELTQDVNNRTDYKVDGNVTAMRARLKRIRRDVQRFIAARQQPQPQPAQGGQQPQLGFFRGLFRAITGY